MPSRHICGRRNMARHISKEEKRWNTIAGRADDLYFAAKVMILEKDPEKKAELLTHVQYFANRFPGNAALVRKAAKDAVRAGINGDFPLPPDAPEEKKLARQLRILLESDDPGKKKQIAALCDDGTYDTMPPELLEEEEDAKDLNFGELEPMQEDMGEDADPEEDDAELERQRKMQIDLVGTLLEMALQGRGLTTLREALWDQDHDNRKARPRIWKEAEAILNEEEVRSAADPGDMEILHDYLQHCAPRVLSMFFHTLADLVKDEDLAERIRKAFPPLTGKQSVKDEENIRTYEGKKMYFARYSIEEVMAIEANDDRSALFEQARLHELTLPEHIRFYVMQKDELNKRAKSGLFPEWEEDTQSD